MARKEAATEAGAAMSPLSGIAHTRPVAAVDLGRPDGDANRHLADSILAPLLGAEKAE
jgi:hypothetical protein